MKIAIDIGYGDVKVCYKNNRGEEKSFKFPTAVELVRGLGLEFSDNGDEVIEFEDALYRIGEDVVSNPFDTRSVDFLLEYSPLLIYKALKKIEEVEAKENEIDIYNNNIATGLSILNWKYQKEYIERIEKFFINGKKFNNKIDLFAQGQGVYLDSKNLYEQNDLVSIVDIGFNTLDVVTFRNGKPLKDLSFATEFGTHLIVIELQKIVEKEFDIDLSEIKIKEILKTGRIKLFGEEKDFSNEIKKLKKKYLKQLLLVLKSKNKSLFKDMDVIIMSGGGTYFLDKNEFPKNVIFSKKPHEFSNVRGYYKGAING